MGRDWPQSRGAVGAVAIMNRRVVSRTAERSSLFFDNTNYEYRPSANWRRRNEYTKNAPRSLPAVAGAQSAEAIRGLTVEPGFYPLLR